MTNGLNTQKFLFIQPYPFTQMVRIEFECLRDLPGIELAFYNLLDSFEFELWGKCAFSPTSFDHGLPHVHCFNINRISRCPELLIQYNATLGFKSMKTAYAMIKGIEVMRALRKGQAESFYFGYPQGKMHLVISIFEM